MAFNHGSGHMNHEKNNPKQAVCVKFDVIKTCTAIHTIGVKSAVPGSKRVAPAVRGITPVVFVVPPCVSLQRSLNSPNHTCDPFTPSLWIVLFLFKSEGYLQT